MPSNPAAVPLNDLVYLLVNVTTSNDLTTTAVTFWLPGISQYASKKGRILRSELIPIEVDGTTVIVSAMVEGGDEEIAGGVLQPFNAAWKPITKIAREIVKSLQEVKPSRATVELGLDFAIQAGHLTALIASGSGGGSLKVTLEWKSD